MAVTHSPTPNVLLLSSAPDGTSKPPHRTAVPMEAGERQRIMSPNMVAPNANGKQQMEMRQRNPFSFHPAELVIRKCYIESLVDSVRAGCLHRGAQPLACRLDPACDVVSSSPWSSLLQKCGCGEVVTLGTAWAWKRLPRLQSPVL